MCCFSGKVLRVEKTRIFARRVDDRTQALAYAMHVDAAADLAMVLPLPTDPAAGESAVSFVDLSGAPFLFAGLSALFPTELALEAAALTSRAAPQGKTLAVQMVGAFEASFVPAVEDFERLDPRFRLAPDVLAALSARERFGFAVFQLRGFARVEPEPAPAPAKRPWWKRVLSRDEPDEPLAPPRAAHSIHPMGLTFRSRAPEALFFPTVHVHDGTLPPTADFDHTLYAQGRADEAWEPSESDLPPHLAERAGGLLLADAPVKRRTLLGEQLNRDVLTPA